jgi:hypothetical protein
MKLTIVLAPLVVLDNRVAGNYGIGEVVAVSCTVTGGGTIAGLGGVIYKIKQGGGTLSAAAPAAGTVTFTASGKAETVKISAFGQNAPNQELAVASLIIVAPTSLKFVKNSNIFHTHGQANAGFRGNIFLQQPGVSYQNLEIQEGAFKGSGTGYYASQNNMPHPASAAPVAVINGNQVNGMDTIYSGIQPPPWSAGKFEWNIPWQYRIIGTADWTTFAYANQVEEINALGVVSVGKFNAGPFSAKPSDPDQAY